MPWGVYFKRIIALAGGQATRYTSTDKFSMSRI